MVYGDGPEELGCDFGAQIVTHRFYFSPTGKRWLGDEGNKGVLDSKQVLYN
jgi:hypothetical protein